MTTHNPTTMFDYTTIIGEKGRLIGKLSKNAPIAEGFPDVMTSAYVFINKCEPKRCPICNNILKVKNFKSGWVGGRAFCSNECRVKGKGISNEKRKETNIERHGIPTPLNHGRFREAGKKTIMERYGVENPASSEEVKNRVRATNLERYGVVAPIQNDEIKERIKQTNIERYGVSCVFDSDEMRRRIKETLMERYGVDNPGRNEEVRRRIKETLMERYGVDVPIKSPEIKERIKKTNMERYGVPNATQSPEVMERVRKTNMERYGVPYHTMTDESKETLKRIKKEQFKSNLNDYGKRIYDDPNFLYDEVSKNGLDVVSKESGISRTPLHVSLRENGFSCNQSIPEKIISNVLEESGIEFQYKVRKPLGGLELDFLIGDVAIEVNGLFWHSETPSSEYGHQSKSYHLKKHELAEEKGIRLLSFTDWEINNRLPVVRSMILNALGKSESIHARKCYVGPVDKKIAKEFCEQNHLHGSANFSFSYGLYHEGELISVMTFGKARFEKSESNELIRFCSKLGYTAVGGASKILSLYKKLNKADLITYSDNMTGNGKVYERCGFEFIKNIPPGYGWTDGKELFSRQQFMKHKLTRFPNYHPDKTEATIMFENGYRRYWNAGNKKFILRVQ